MFTFAIKLKGMKKNKALQTTKNIFKVIITIGALYWLFTNFKFDEFKTSLLTANYFYLLLAFITYIISQLIASSRLNSFFKTIHLKLSEIYNIKLYWLGLLFNFFLPGGVGGDAYKVFFLKKKYNVSTQKLLSAVFFDRLSGLWAMAIFSAAFIVFMPRFAIPNYITIGAVLIGTISYLYILYLFFRPFAKRFLQTHIKALGVQGFQVLTAILILLALNHSDKFSPHLLIFLLSSVVAIIPSILGAIGIRDNAAIELASYLGVDEQLAGSITLIFYFISLITALPGLYLTFRPKGLGEDKLPSAKEVEKEIIDNEKTEEI